MGKSNFKVMCPHCGQENNFIDDNWRDELVDDSQSHEIDCLSCAFPMIIEVEATYVIRLADDQLPE